MSDGTARAAAGGRASGPSRRQPPGSERAPSRPPRAADRATGDPDAAFRVRWGAAVVAAAFASGLVVAPRLYLTTRSFPLTPLLEALPPIPSPLDLVLYLALLVALAAAALRPAWAIGTGAAVGLAIVLAVGDQSRWQPWFYQYVVMLSVLALRPRHPRQTLETWRLLIACTYLWSGIQKLNFTFVAKVFPWLVEPVAGWLPARIQHVVQASGLVAPLAEASIALLLLSRRYRNVAVGAAVAMHAVILLAVGPLGHSTNPIIWPWNVAMALLVALLFWRAPGGAWEILLPRRVGAHAVALILFGITPALSFAGWWDAYLSAALYSGTIKTGHVMVSDEVRGALPPEVRQRLEAKRPGVNVLDLWEWSMAELNAPSYPETRVFRHIALSFCEYPGSATGVVLLVLDRPGLLTGIPEARRYDCAALGGAGR